MDKVKKTQKPSPVAGAKQRAVRKTRRAQTATTPSPAAVEPEAGESGDQSEDIPVVGIGASAGGLEALQQLFKHLPTGCRLAFVVIQHLNPRYKSAMDQLLSATTPLTIAQIKHNLKIKPGHIYLNPAGRYVSLVNGHFRLKTDRMGNVSLPIDYFFRSLAEAKGKKAIGVILSGSASDGTEGVKAIKAAGGLTIAQSPGNAKYPSMPDSAIATHMVDFIVPAESIGAKLDAIVKHPYLRIADMPDVGNETEDQWADLKRIFSILHNKTGHDFSNYKTTTIRRRIARRMAVHQIDQLTDYVRVVARDPAEPARLLKDMLIGVTSFFRDADAFETLRDKVMVPLIESRKNGEGIRVWVAGCSTGEEAYSMAILLAEAMERAGRLMTMQIFASDIDADAIDTARHGIYLPNIAADVSPQRLARFFDRGEDAFKIKKNIRDGIVFSIHNLIKDPPFSKIDLICCRNLLIYLKPELQKKVLPMFHYALKSDGFLFLGPSETIGEFGDHFSAVSLKYKIFKHRDTPPAEPYSIDHLPVFAGQENHAEAEKRERTIVPDIFSFTERIILDEFAPPGVLIDRNFDILHFFGHTDPFLKTPRGKASFNLLKMAREGIALKLSRGLNLALKSGEMQRIEDVSVKSPQGAMRTGITVRPVAETPGRMDVMIVLFEAVKGREKKAAVPASTAEEPDIPADIKRLEEELKTTKEYLQASIEELETSNEEYKATNEELQSVNEELQSANEELETSREELQSTNEELVTVNSEHQQKIDELNKSYNDINNLLESTEIATLFLNLNLCVRRFTPAVTRIINLRQTDIGRPISDITTQIQGADIHSLTVEVIEHLERKKLEVQDKKGRWYEMRILPYRTGDNVIDGVTIAFIDITDLRRVNMLRQSSAVFENATDAGTLQDFDGNILAWNRTAESLYGWTEAEATRMHISEITAEKDRHGYAAVARRLQRGETVSTFEIVRIPKSAEPMAVRVHASALADENGRPVKFATFERPLTSAKASP